MSKILVLSVFLWLNFAQIWSLENATSSGSSANIFNLDKNSTVANYIETLAKTSEIDFTVILTRAKYFQNGSMEYIETAVLSSEEDKNPKKVFNFTTISKRTIEKLVVDAEDKAVLLSLLQKKRTDAGYKIKRFNTKVLEKEHSAAENIAIHTSGFTIGLNREVSDTMDMTEDKAIVQILEYFDSGNIKRNTTTTLYPSKVVVKSSSKMSSKMRKGCIELLKKAYKVETDDRAPIIHNLFQQKYPQHSWRIFVNATNYVVDKEVAIKLAIGHDQYDIVGV